MYLAEFAPYASLISLFQAYSHVSKVASRLVSARLLLLFFLNVKFLSFFLIITKSSAGLSGRPIISLRMLAHSLIKS